ncbi:exported hypothetical protein [Tenacibaculum litopenaei]|jgi:hypothetical protein|uniref:hypothetical protein n=1 Tax=Tenacibaculum litopenaei TaxID=396016 RepID=UPI0038934619
MFGKNQHRVVITILLLLLGFQLIGNSTAIQAAEATNTPFELVFSETEVFPTSIQNTTDTEDEPLFAEVEEDLEEEENTQPKKLLATSSFFSGTDFGSLLLIFDSGDEQWPLVSKGNHLYLFYEVFRL